MRESLRVDYVTRLIEGIGRIGPGPMFERFGAKFLDHHLDVALVHRGLNAQLSPVGRTIDSYDDAGEVGAEYSIEQDYFQGAMGKASRDLLHVLRKHPQVEDIYLLSSRKASEGDIPAYTQRVGQWPGMLGRQLHIYDARRIAEVIVDELLMSDAAIDDLVEQIPALAAIIDDAAASLAVPDIDAHHVERPEVAAMIAAALAGRGPVATVAGIGGLGKSEAVIAYAAEHRESYDTCMWIDGDALRRPTDLKAIALWRGGSSRNVAAMLRARSCLLIIDDVADTILADELASYCGAGSHVILTRRSPREGDVVVPMLSREQARAILDQGLAEPCPDAVLDELLRTVGGHPLSLALVNSVIAEGASWDDIAADCAGIPELTRGDQRLADRLLGRLAGALSHELQLFEWAGQAHCDLRFLRRAISSIGIAKLRHHGLTAPDRPSTLRLHDIIQASVMTQRWLTPARAAALDDLLETLIENLMAEEGLALRILASTMRAKLEALAELAPRPAFIVALLEIWKASETRRELLPDVAAAAEALAEAETPPRPAQVRAIFETIEGLYRLDKLTSIDAAKENLRAALPVFERLAAVQGLDSRTETEIRHHHAKALKNVGENAVAQAMLEEVLAGPHPLYASRLQLVRLYGYSKDTVDKSAQQADLILTAAGEAGEVSSNVVLATLQSLPSAGGKWRQQLFDRHADLIEHEIVVAADAGADDALRAFAAVARHWSWNDRDRLLRVFAGIELIDPSLLEDSTSAACGEVFAEVAKGRGGIDQGFQAQALRYYEAVRAPSDYGLQKHGQLLIEMGRHADAEAVLARIAEPGPFAFYRLSQAQLPQGKRDEARDAIEKAIAGLAPDQAHFRTTFLVQRFEARRALSDPAAREDLEEAYRLCEPGRYKDALARRLAEAA